MWTAILATLNVVDDTPANLQVLASMLKDRGYKVRPVPGGELALRAARRDPPDIILLDINMPEMSGYEVCRHLKADERLAAVPILLATAHAMKGDAERLIRESGADAYIAKPIGDPQGFVAKVEACARRATTGAK